MLIATTATLSLLLVGLLAIAATPDRSADPVAVQATTATSARLAALEQPVLPIVAPLGDDGWGVMTPGAVGSRSGLMSARLPSGVVIDVEIVRRDAESGLTLVSLPAPTVGYELATSDPRPSDTVVVQGPRPQVVALDEVSGLDVDEGAPVLDDEGALVGICTKRPDGVSVMTVSTMPGAPTVTPTTAPRPTTTSPSTVATVATTTTPAPTSTSTPPATTTPTTATPTTVVESTLPATESTVAAPTTTAPTRPDDAGSTSAPD